MTPICIHSVPTQQCASCRVCDHGVAVARCSRCQAAFAKKPNPDPQPAEEFEHHEIFFVPAENSWYFRAPDSTGAVSAESYRSAFQARRAVAASLASEPSSAKHSNAPKTAKRRKQ